MDQGLGGGRGHKILKIGGKRRGKAKMLFFETEGSG